MTDRNQSVLRILLVHAMAVLLPPLLCRAAAPQKAKHPVDQYDVVWESPSSNAAGSMPCSGGDIGLNVWVEGNDLLFYIGRAGCRDENGALLKLGRVRISLSGNPFGKGSKFRQQLSLTQGSIEISGHSAIDNYKSTITVWVEVHRPIVHVDVASEEPVTAEAVYEAWRLEDIELPDDRSKHGRRAMCMINYDAYPGNVWLYKDEIRAEKDQVRFAHRVDNSRDCFNFQVKQQGLEAIRSNLVNPLENLVWGGAMVGDGFVLAGETSGTYAECPYRGWKYISQGPATSHRIRIYLHTDQVGNLKDWDEGLRNLIDASPKSDRDAWQRNLRWWSDFWNRSHLIINPGRGENDAPWRLGRNYQLFRYMLASNRSGREPTVFNGGLFTFDPMFVNRRKGPGYTPDHRQWGAAFTAQNQRLVYRPMLKTGDFGLLPPGFSFYLKGLPNAMARVRHYWGHDGCAFEEQSAITALPGSCQYGFFEGGRRGRPKNFEVGVQINHAGGKVYEEQLDWSWLILQYHLFSGNDISRYLPFIEQSVIFYDEHYRYRCKKITGKELDDGGKLAIYPANTLENHWDCRNPTSVIAGLRRVLTELLHLPARYTSAEKQKRWREILARLPDMPKGGGKEYRGEYFKPAENYEHRNWICPEMFPLFPYEMYGLGLPDLDIMQRTSRATGKDRTAVTAWQPANIFAARLGDVKLARDLNTAKLSNGPFRFPAFWPATIDWAPDHNWGGCGMIGLQEMLMQTHTPSLEDLRRDERGKIRLLPAWPKDWDVDFKLHAPCKTMVEGSVQAGQIVYLEITPQARRKDVVMMGAK